MMHCTMDDLGALQAGEASVWARRHITTCATCQAELEKLYQRVAQLKALPALRPPRDRWPAVQSILRTERSRRRRTWGAWSGSLALAATIAAVLLIQPPNTTVLHAELSQVKQQSATLEDSLKQFDVESSVLSGHEAATMAALEDRISLLDGTLAQRVEGAHEGDAQLVRLWQERVGLMRELVKARATRARYVGL
jgi:ferric-dicitrate binding protein FerR (iron transport regulator)